LHFGSLRRPVLAIFNTFNALELLLARCGVSNRSERVLVPRVHQQVAVHALLPLPLHQLLGFVGQVVLGNFYQFGLCAQTLLQVKIDAPVVLWCRKIEWRRQDRGSVYLSRDFIDLLLYVKFNRRVELNLDWLRCLWDLNSLRSHRQLILFLITQLLMGLRLLELHLSLSVLFKLSLLH